MRVERDSGAQYIAAFLFSISLGIAAVAYPLLVLDQGHSLTVAGLLIALSATAQVLTRWHLGTVMRLVSNATLVVGAAALLALSNLVVVGNVSFASLTASSVIQGVARACFWTGNQVHIVRSGRPTSTGIATLNLVATLAMLIGPVVGGILAGRSLSQAFAAATIVAAIGVAPTFLLERLPPFASVGGHGYVDLLQHPGVRLGVWVSITVGLWRGILGSYVPIGLYEIGTTETTIGIVIAIANAAVSAGGFLAGRIPAPKVAINAACWSTVIGVTTAMVGFELQASVITVALAVGGIGVGLLQVLAITAVSDAVHPELRGDAVTLAGVARGTTLSAAPLGVAGLLLIMGLGPAVLVATVALVAPTIFLSGRQSRAKRAEG
jgi:MFS family permease